MSYLPKKGALRPEEVDVALFEEKNPNGALFEEEKSLMGHFSVPDRDLL